MIENSKKMTLFNLMSSKMNQQMNPLIKQVLKHVTIHRNQKAQN